MAITASSIQPNNTLEEFRIQFNRLVVDVEGVAAGNTFAQNIIFEGATADENETTLTVIDPTADNVIELPNVGASGTNPGSAAGNARVITTMNASDGTLTTSSSDADFVLISDNGILKRITPSNLGITGATAADDIATGDGAVTIATNTGNITIDNQAGDADIIFKGTDGSSDITPLTLDMSEAGLAIFTGDVSLADEKKLILGSNNDISLKYNETSTDTLMISSDVDDAALGIIFQADAGADAGDEWKMNFANGGTFTFGNDIASAGTHATLLTITPNSTAANSTHAFIGKVSASSTITATGGLLLADGGSIGSASDTDAITISSGGDVAITGGGLSLIDGEKVVLGGDSDIGIQYDESVTDSLLISADVDGAALGVVFAADRGDLAADKWKMGFADNGTFTFGNDIASKNTFVTMLTITPHATASSATMAFTGSITAAGATLKAAGKETIYVPATAMYPNTTNGCAALAQVELATDGTRPELKVLDFDKDATEFAQFSVAFPKSYNADHVSFRVFWIGDASTNGVAWALQGLSAGDGAEADAAFGTAVVVQDDSQNDATEVLVTSESGNVTLSGEGDDKMTFFQIYRDHDDGNDDMAADARLVGIQLFYTSDLANDA